MVKVNFVKDVFELKNDLSFDTGRLLGFTVCSNSPAPDIYKLKMTQLSIEKKSLASLQRCDLHSEIDFWEHYQMVFFIPIEIGKPSLVKKLSLLTKFVLNIKSCFIECNASLEKQTNLTQ